MNGSTLHVRFNETTTSARLQPDGTIEIGDARFTIEALEPGVYVVDSSEGRRTVAVAGPADDRWLSVDGQVFQVEVATEARARKKTGNQGSLMAPMPATVVKLLVEPGATVAEGDTLIVLEAMKMELPIRAPRAGVVSAIRCKAGELVQPNVALLEIS